MLPKLLLYLVPFLVLALPLAFLLVTVAYTLLRVIFVLALCREEERAEAILALMGVRLGRNIEAKSSTR